MMIPLLLLQKLHTNNNKKETQKAFLHLRSSSSVRFCVVAAIWMCMLAHVETQNAIE